MASVYPHRKSGVFRISYHLNGKRYIKSLKTKDRTLARKIKKEYEVKLDRGLLSATMRAPIEQYYQEYLQDTSHRKRSTNRGEYTYIIKFLRETGKKTVNSITHEDIRRFVSKYDDHKPQTYNHVLVFLRRFFKLAVQKTYILKNPVDGISRKKVPEAEPRFFTDEEYIKIEKTAEGDPLYPMIVTARFTGLRLGELRHLEWQDFDWNRKLLKVLNKEKWGHTIKNYQMRIVPISDALREKLLPYIRKEGVCFPTHKGKRAGNPYGEAGPRRQIRHLLMMADIKARDKLGWHEFRHTFASRLVQQNVPIYKVSKWLGHSDLATTQIYAHLAPQYDIDIEKLTIPENPSQNPSFDYIVNETSFQ